MLPQYCFINTMHKKVMCMPGLPSMLHRRDYMLSVVLNLAIYTEKNPYGRFQGYGLKLGLITHGSICFSYINSIWDPNC